MPHWRRGLVGAVDGAGRKEVERLGRDPAQKHLPHEPLIQHTPNTPHTALQAGPPASPISPTDQLRMAREGC